jgi:HEPN domain-containing protein
MAQATADDWYRSSKSELESARVLKSAGKANEAYFHAGQSVEFILKALFLKRNNLKFMPDTHKGAHWHDLQSCAEASRLKADLNQKDTSRSLKANWLTVRDWKSNGRFPDMKVPKQELNDLFVAVCNDADGVWQWLEKLYLSI